MKNKFIRVLSPLALCIYGVLAALSLLLGIGGIYGIIKAPRLATAALILIAAAVAAAVILTAVKMKNNGVRFGETQVEFTLTDHDNRYYYKDIEKAEAHKDTKASLTKRYTDRYARLVLHLRDGSIATIELGDATKRTLLKIQNELNQKIKGE